MTTNLHYTQGFRTLFIDPVDATAGGAARIDYIGGREITPASKAASALRRGVVAGEAGLR
jgi:hypothetical protein